MFFLFHFVRRILCISLIASCLVTIGCSDLSFQRSPLLFYSTFDEKPPQVITMRGFLGIFSLGMDTLSKRVNKELHCTSLSVAALEWPRLASYLIKQQQVGHKLSPLILIGHSEGADDQIEVARRLAYYHIPVDLLILIAPFNTNPIPSNVNHAVVIDRSFEIGKVVPFLGYVPIHLQDPHKTHLEILELSTTPMPFKTNLINHFNIDKNRQVQDIILAKIKTLQSKRYFDRVSSSR